MQTVGMWRSNAGELAVATQGPHEAMWAMGNQHYVSGDQLGKSKYYQDLMEWSQIMCYWVMDINRLFADY